MKANREEPRLTAFALGELTPGEAAAVESAAAADGGVRNTIEQTRAIADRLQRALGTGEDSLTPSNRANILKAAKESARQGKVIRLKSHREARKSWFLPLAAAVVVGAGLFLLTMVPAPKGKKLGTVAGNAGSGSQVGKNSNADEISNLSRDAGRKSLAQITTAIRNEGRLPRKDEVRIGEMLNSFPLKAKGYAALSKGCSLGAEIIPCPWKPSGNLVFITLQGAIDSEHSASIQFQADEAGSAPRQLLPSVQNESSPSQVLIRAGERRVILLETGGDGSILGEIAWTVDGSSAPAIPLVRDRASEPSDDVGFATLVNAFGLWLRGEGKPAVNEELITGLVREVAAGSLVADRYDFLNLVDQGLRIATEPISD